MFCAVVSGFALAVLAPFTVKTFGKKASLLLALVPLVVTLYLFSFAGTVSGGEALVSTEPWIPELGINLSFHLDGLSLIFGLLIAGIGFLIFIYAGGYLAGHPQLGRFYVYLSMFMASMLGVVLSDNLILLFVFWELTSLSSYLLIGFDHEKAESRAAALQALIVTGIGGLCLLAGVILLGTVAGSFEISTILGSGDIVRSHPLYLPILGLILLGAFTKSAQFPFYFWLPSAMQAPTPVSAYLHSATMVKAGVYLLARLSPVLGATAEWRYVVTAIGALTMIIGVLLALPQTDLKRILAYSTVAVLGTLTLLIGLDTTLSMQACMVFLVAHSAYKGALFMVAGTIDHETGTRDVRLLGGLRHVMPITAASAVLAGLSMAGLPPLFGFMAKELAYEAEIHAQGAAWFITGAGFVASALMVAIALILVRDVFFGKEKRTPKHAHEAPASLWAGPVALGLLGIFMGLFPNLITGPLLAAGVSSVRLEVTPFELALWHGLNPTLLLSGVTLLFGFVVYQIRATAAVACQRLDFALLSPERIYQTVLNGAMSFAKVQSNILQSGYLRLYLSIVMGALVVLLGFTLLPRVHIETAWDWSDVRVHEAAITILIIIATFSVIRASSRFAAVVSLGVIGYGVALLFILFGAPDLAITQFLVETLTVILLALVLYHLPGFTARSNVATRARDALVSLALGGMMTVFVLAATSVAPETSITEYYGEHSMTEAHGRNLVNVILVDFRALDTLGEITVLCIAGVGVYALLKLRIGKAK